MPHRFGFANAGSERVGGGSAGVYTVLFGLGAFVGRGITLAALVILYGAYALADGVPAVGAAMSGRRSGPLPWGVLLAGLAAIAATVVTFRWPGARSMVRVDLGKSVPALAGTAGKEVNDKPGVMSAPINPSREDGTMLTQRGGCSLGLLVVACVILATAGCASTATSPPKALNDMYGIAGRWVGTCNLGSGLEPCNIVIGQDGFFNANAGAVTILGRATVAGGRGTFDAGTVAGDIAVYETNACRRQMVVKGSKGSATGELIQDGAPARMVRSLSEVAGRWDGTCDLGSGAVPCAIEIGADGSFAVSAGASSAVGKVAVVNGRAVFDTGPAGGDIVLHEGAGCKRQIAVVGSRGVAKGQLTAQ